jgi:hypothetical protein
MARPERVLGGVGTALLFENDQVRIWEMDLAPGERTAVHRHDLDYILVQIAGDRIAGISEPDTRGPYPGTVESDVVPGRWIYIGKGGIETAVNTGKERYYEILIELKGTA